MPSELFDSDIIINLGDSYFNDYDYPDTLIINKSRAIQRCVNKRKMFNVLKGAGVPILDFYDLRDSKGYRNALIKAAMGHKVLLRGKGKRIYSLTDFEGFKGNTIGMSYATAFEEKRYEWRIVVFRGKAIRNWVKLPIGGGIFWHKDNCIFMKGYRKEAEQIAIQAAKALGIDLCGVDVLENDKGELKVIEVNSCPSLSDSTIKKIYNKLKCLN